MTPDSRGAVLPTRWHQHYSAVRHGATHVRHGATQHGAIRNDVMLRAAAVL